MNRLEMKKKLLLKEMRIDFWERYQRLLSEDAKHMQLDDISLLGRGR